VKAVVGISVDLDAAEYIRVKGGSVFIFDAQRMAMC